MISWSLQAELADIHSHIEKLPSDAHAAATDEIEELRARLREVERHLGLSRTIS